METVEHIVVRFRHVKRLLQLAISAKNSADRRKSFISAIKYHKSAICMSEMVNDSFEGCMFVHIFLTAGVLGCASYRMMKSFSLSAACLFIGYMFSAVMVCFVGQRLINESISVGSAVYSTQWYDLEQSLQKDIGMIIRRSQKPLSLKGGPFGTMNYSLLLTILKTSYTYLTLLNRTNNRQ